MCGLVGMAGNLGLKDTEVFSNMFDFDVVRGSDSSGVAVAYDVNNPEAMQLGVFKEIGTPSNLYNSYSKFFTPTYGKGEGLIPSHKLNVVIGHNRKATQGTITKDTAHPFRFSNLVGAHNGTVSKVDLRDFTGYGKFDVDSQILYSHLNETGNVQDLWDATDDPMALTWFDIQTNSVNLARNIHRPLTYVFNKAGDVIYWASEGWMLTVALGRNNVKHGEIQQLTADTHHVYTFEKKNKKIEEQIFTLKIKKSMVYTGYKNWMKESTEKDKPFPPPVKTSTLAPASRELVFSIESWGSVEAHSGGTVNFLIGKTVDQSSVKIYVDPKDWQTVVEEVLEKPKDAFFITKKAFLQKDPDYKYGAFWSKVEEVMPTVVQSKVKDDDTATGWLGVKLTKTEFETTTKFGCCWCGADLDWEGAVLNQYYWYDDSSCACATCKSTQDYYGENTRVH